MCSSFVRLYDQIRKQLKKNSIVVLTFLHMFILTTPSGTPADQVSKNSVILKEVRQLQDLKGLLIAQESIYGGGISGLRSNQDTRGEGNGIALRELRPPQGAFTFTKDVTTISVKVLPLVGRRDHNDVWSPATGKWDFKNRETNSYESVIQVKKGGDLDIVYQSTGMSVGNQENVVHYGLSGNPHAISLSRKRLKNAFASQISSDNKPILNYQPPDDVILVRLELTSKGFLFQPIFDYQVVKH